MPQIKGKTQLLSINPLIVSLNIEDCLTRDTKRDAARRNICAHFFLHCKFVACFPMKIPCLYLRDFGVWKLRKRERGRIKNIVSEVWEKNVIRLNVPTFDYSMSRARIIGHQARYYRYVDAANEGGPEPTRRKARYDRHDRARCTIPHTLSFSLATIIDRLITPILSKTTEMQSLGPPSTLR